MKTIYMNNCLRSSIAIWCLLFINFISVSSTNSTVESVTDRSMLEGNSSAIGSCPCCLGSGLEPSPPWVNNGGIILLVITVIAMFWGLSLVCEDYFVPALNVLCEEYSK